MWHGHGHTHICTEPERARNAPDHDGQAGGDDAYERKREWYKRQRMGARLGRNGQRCARRAGEACGGAGGKWGREAKGRRARGVEREEEARARKATSPTADVARAERACVQHRQPYTRQAPAASEGTAVTDPLTTRACRPPSRRRARGASGRTCPALSRTRRCTSRGRRWGDWRVAGQ